MRTNLKKIAKISAGYPFRGKIPDIPGSSVRVVQMRDVSRVQGVNWAACITSELMGKREPDFLQTDDILVAARGSHHYAVRIDEVLQTSGLQSVAAPHFFVVRVKKDTVLPEFLAWQLNQKYSQRYLEQNAEGSVTKSIRRSVLETTPLSIPPLEQQHRIIAVAKLLHEEHRLLQALISNSERIMEAIAKDLFDDKEVPQ